MQRKRAVSVLYIHHQTKKAKLREHHISLSLLVQPPSHLHNGLMDCNGVQLDDTCSSPYTQPHPRIREAASKPADVWQIRPIWHPLVGSGIPFPAPVTGIRDLLDSREGLIPDESWCVNSPLGMLEDSILVRWDGVERLEAMNISFIASLTDWAAQFLLYIGLSTVKRSRRLIWRESSFRLAWYWVIAVNVVMASGKFTHAFHAVFLPIPIMEDTTSQPVKAWKKGRAW